jgi:hypothetical protein
MVKDALREGLTGSTGTQVSRETERLVDREVSLDSDHRGTRALLLREDVTTATVKNTIDTTDSRVGALDFDQEDGFLDTRAGSENGSVDNTTAGRDDLTTTTMDSISVKSNIQDVESASTKVLISNRTFLGGPLESGNARILDFAKVLDSLGGVNQQVGTSSVGTETPNLTGFSNIPTVLVSELTSTNLEIVTRSNLASFDLVGKFIIKGHTTHVDTVVLVGRLGQTVNGGLSLDGLTVLDDGVTELERNTSVIFLKILQTNFKMEFTSTGNNVFTRLVGEGKNTGIGLGETLETFDKLGQIVGVLDIDSALDDRRDRELHDLHVVSSVGGGDGTRLDQELINTDKTNNVTSGAVLNGFNVTSHHENSTLDRLDEKIGLGTGLVVGTLDTDLKTRADGTREDTTESVETTLVRGGNHLGDVKHERSGGVAVTDTNSALVIKGTFVQVLDTVSLSSDGRGKVDTDHLKESITSGKELAHNNLEKLLALKILLISSELNLELLKKSGGLVLLEVHNRVEDLEDRVQDEHVESTLQRLAISIVGLGGPLLGLGVEVVLTPELLHHLFLVNTELLGVTDGELTKGETPTVETRGESNGTLLGVDLAVTENLIDIGGDDDVDGFDGTLESLNGKMEKKIGFGGLEKILLGLRDGTFYVGSNQ